MIGSAIKFPKAGKPFMSMLPIGGQKIAGNTLFESWADLFAARLFQSKMEETAVILFASEHAAVHAQKTLGLESQPATEVFRFCSHHRSIHPVSFFLEGELTCKERVQTMSDVF